MNTTSPTTPPQSATTSPSKFEELVKQYGGKVYWDDITTAYPCLRDNRLSKTKCKTCHWPCKEKDPIQVIVNILQNEKLRSEPGGLYADRLLTALSAGVPFFVIERSHYINLPVALAALGQTREWAKEEATRRNRELYGCSSK